MIRLLTNNDTEGVTRQMNQGLTLDWCTQSANKSITEQRTGHGQKLNKITRWTSMSSGKSWQLLQLWKLEGLKES